MKMIYENSPYVLPLVCDLPHKTPFLYEGKTYIKFTKNTTGTYRVFCLDDMDWKTVPGSVPVRTVNVDCRVRVLH